MTVIGRLTLAGGVLVLAACDKAPAPLDDALRQDLSLATQAYMPQQFVSPLEGGYMPNGYAPAGYPQPGYAQQPYGYRQPVARVATSPVRRSTGTAGRASGGEVIKHTKRDAVIGAAAGAAIGAVTSAKKDRLKGAVLGAAVGAVLGGVVGNNVDIKR
jgi:hypothetical protein